MATASDPFEATDDNGITVKGTVDVYRHPKGPFFDLQASIIRNLGTRMHISIISTRERPARSIETS